MGLVEIVVPPLGESISEATLNRWLKPDGAMVHGDEPVAELGTDKATQEIPAPTTGRLSHRVRAGEVLRVGMVIATIDPQAVEDVASQLTATAESSSISASSSSPASVSAVSVPVTAQIAPRSSGPPPQAGLPSPAAARLLAEAQLNAVDVPGTGPGGRITKADVLSAIYQRQSTETSVEPAGPVKQEGVTAATVVSPPSSAIPSSSRKTTRSPMTAIRRHIAERLLHSQQTTATLTTFNEADLSAINDLRQRYGERFEKKHGVKLGLMSFFVKAAIEALKAFPIVNARIDGTDIVYHHYYDISVAVSTDRGLMVPVIRDADRLSLAELERAIAELARKAREGKITVQDLEGGTFTITNGGVFGSLLSTPILNPPQVAILGMHAIQKRPVVVDNQIVIRPMMYLALSYDHRLIDGREAVQFLIRIKECVENPAVLLLDLI